MRVARRLLKPLKRKLSVNGAYVIVQLTPDGLIRCRGWYQKRWFTVRLAELFPHAVADAGGVPGEQTDLALDGLTREEPRTTTREGSHEA